MTKAGWLTILRHLWSVVQHGAPIALDAAQALAASGVVKADPKVAIAIQVAQAIEAAAKTRQNRNDGLMS